MRSIVFVGTDLVYRRTPIAAARFTRTPGGWRRLKRAEAFAAWMRAAADRPAPGPASTGSGRLDAGLRAVPQLAGVTRRDRAPRRVFNATGAGILRGDHQIGQEESRSGARGARRHGRGMRRRGTTHMAAAFIVSSNGPSKGGAGSDGAVAGFAGDTASSEQIAGGLDAACAASTVAARHRRQPLESSNRVAAVFMAAATEHRPINGRRVVMVVLHGPTSRAPRPPLMKHTDRGGLRTAFNGVPNDFGSHQPGRGHQGRGQRHDHRLQQDGKPGVLWRNPAAPTSSGT